MSKLFSTADLINFKVKDNVLNGSVDNTNDENLTVSISEYKDSVNVALESFKQASNDIVLLSDIKSSLEDKTRSTALYFITLENHHLALKTITDNLGINTKIPALEDFKNPYGFESSHKIAIEGFTDYANKIWENIKNFFKNFFKKITEFLKKLINADLTIDTYEQSTSKILHMITNKNLVIKDTSKLESKLPSILADEGMQIIDNNYVTGPGLTKIGNLVNRINDISKRLPEFTDKYKKALHILEKEGKNVDKKVLTDYNNIVDDLFNNVFKYPCKLSDLPEKGYDEVTRLLDNSATPDKCKIFSFIDTSNKYEQLPNNYNVYIATIALSKITVFSINERNSYVNNTINPISNSRNLQLLYTDYKKIFKGLDLDNFQTKIHKAQNDIESSISLANKVFSNLIYSVTGENISIKGKPIDYRELLDDDLGNDLPEARLITQTDITDKEDNSINTDIDNLQNSETELIKQIQDTQSYVLNSLYNLQVLLREISSNLVGTVMETKFELIKYIYNSGRRFR